MLAYGYKTAHALKDFQIQAHDLPMPELGENDVLVKIKAVSFNPVDTKIRQSRSAKDNEFVTLGWDASGSVHQIGKNVTEFKTGDDVYYAGDLMRAGSNAEFQAVDQRLIARKPKSLNFAEAATLPLTSLTAWEALFERNFEFTPETRVLIIGGAGGVGSIAIQLLKVLTPATVIATASRPETIDWVKEMGADHVIGRDIDADLKNIGIENIDIIFSTTHTDSYLQIIPKILRPFGHLVLIDDPKSLDIVPFKAKALSVHWEFMFAKSMFGFKPEQQGKFLANLAQWVDEEKIKTTLNQTFDASEANIKKAHETLETGQAIGKIAMNF